MRLKHPKPEEKLAPRTGSATWFNALTVAADERVPSAERMEATGDGVAAQTLSFGVLLSR
jgi:hypothetical protein